MSIDLFPYVRPLAIAHLAGLGLPAQHLRKEEVLSVLGREILKAVNVYEINDLIDESTFSNLLFDDLVSKKVLREEVEKYAGSYWRFNSPQMKIWAVEFPKSDSVSQAARRIGKRFYPDVFDGFRAENGFAKEDSGTLVPRSVIAGQNWSEVASSITTESRENIKAKVADLIEAINQSDLDERMQRNALKRAESVALLLEAPDPPWEIVVDLLNNRYLQAFLSALTIVQLIIGMAA